MKYHIAVVEDDSSYANQLTGFIHRFEKEQDMEIQISSFSNGMAILDEYHSQYDLILLDIEMPLLDGMSTAEAIRRQDEDVLLIFVTNLAQYAIRGYGVNALDYVLKPITYPAFAMKMLRALRVIEKKKQDFVLLAGENGAVRVSTSEIRYIDIADHLLTYHTTESNYQTFGSLKEVEKQMGDTFVRINHCYLVNLRYVEGYTDEMVRVGEENLKISRAKKKEFLQKLTRYYQSGGI